MCPTSSRRSRSTGARAQRRRAAAFLRSGQTATPPRPATPPGSAGAGGQQASAGPEVRVLADAALEVELGAEVCIVAVAERDGLVGEHARAVGRTLDIVGTSWTLRMLREACLT